MNNQMELNLSGRYQWPNPQSSVARALGRERIIFEIGGVKLAKPRIVRDPAGWSPGSTIKSVTGRTYTVAPDGSLRRYITKPNWRSVRTYRRAVAAGRIQGSHLDRVRAARKEVA